MEVFLNHQVSIDYYAYKSGIRDWNSTYKVAFATAAVVLVVALDNLWVSVMTVFFMMAASVGKGKIRFRDYLRLLSIPLFFILFSSIAIMINFGNPNLALRTAVKALGAVSALYMLSLSTPIGEILSVLRKIHIPDLLLELMHLIYRYIFILSDINRRQKDAARSRLGYINYRTSLRTFGKELANLFLLSMKKSESYYDAMEARGYEGKGLFWEEKKDFTLTQFLWGAGYVFLVVICLAERIYA
jgi:cobalt/nickel transport system permease protein